MKRRKALVGSHGGQDRRRERAGADWTSADADATAVVESLMLATRSSASQTSDQRVPVHTPAHTLGLRSA